ncbi:MAG TPA: glycosyltransferase [Pirellulales bacterium]|nr:glycosyltransferase [Pirellulales bacterium]
MSAPIYFEVFPLLVPRMTGIGRFSARLVQALNQLAPLRLTTFLDPRTARVHRLGTDLQQGEEIEAPIGALADAGEDLPGWARSVCQLPKRPFDARGALQHTGVYLWSRPDERHFGRELTIFYDFTPLIVSWSHTTGLCEAFHRQVSAARHCEKVLAISHSTRADAAWLSPVPEEDIEVAYPGPSQCLARHAFSQPVSRRRNVMLVVGTREPRKNGDFLLDWFLNTAVLAPDAELWWAGPEGWLWDGPTGLNRHPRFHRIKFLGMVSDARLCELYQQAAMTIYPSLYEGFGFPVLDSLLHGAPVLCSYNSSLAELESPGVFYFDPCDAATLDAAYRELLSAGRIDIDQAALRERFSWSRMAQTMLAMAG